MHDYYTAGPSQALAPDDMTCVASFLYSGRTWRHICTGTSAHSCAFKVFELCMFCHYLKG